ncbi:MAG TPA: tetratricopeptide repeat protein [Defluviicoccus sp.]|nr:tetratricopeptide repeat protein [Defluviicoccus sp.]
MNARALSPAVIRRFIILMVVATFVMFTAWAVVREYLEAPPGDYETRQGDILLTDRKYDEAIAKFSEALERSPNHRGAMMGRAITLLQGGRHDEAEAEFSHLIAFLTETVEPDDATGIGVLAAAYANRGILYDREGRFEAALADYREALKIDAGAVAGPGLMHKVLLHARPSTVADRARYLQEQLALPEDQRVLHVPEIDAKQRMHKP